MKMMFVTLKEKRAIFNSFSEIIEVKEGNNEYSYYFNNNDSIIQIGKGFNENGEGYIYSRKIDERGNSNWGWVDVKNYTANGIRELLQNIINSNLH